MAATEVKVPDIGDFKDVPIIEVHVKEGEPINAEDPIVTLESDKATMDVPSPASGTVEKLLVKVGDKVSEGSPVLQLRGNEEGAMTQPPSLLSQQEPPARRPGKHGAPRAAVRPARRARATRRRRRRRRHRASTGSPISARSTPALASAGSRASWASI